jgi:hypothetical protein
MCRRRPRNQVGAARRRHMHARTCIVQQAASQRQEGAQVAPTGASALTVRLRSPLPAMARLYHGIVVCTTALVVAVVMAHDIAGEAAQWQQLQLHEEEEKTGSSSLKNASSDESNLNPASGTRRDQQQQQEEEKRLEWQLTSPQRRLQRSRSSSSSSRSSYYSSSSRSSYYSDNSRRRSNYYVSSPTAAAAAPSSSGSSTEKSKQSKGMIVALLVLLLGFVGGCYLARRYLRGLQSTKRVGAYHSEPEHMTIEQNISRYNQDYYCEVTGVQVNAGAVSVSFHVRGNGSLGGIQNPKKSTLLLFSGERIMEKFTVFESNISMQTYTQIVGVLSYRVGTHEHGPFGFAYGDGDGYSIANLSFGNPTTSSLPIAESTPVAISMPVAQSVPVVAVCQMVNPVSMASEGFLGHQIDDVGSTKVVQAETQVETSAWKIGDVVDVETEDGWELGAQIIGPSKSGEEGAFRIRFADGVIDDWIAEEFRVHKPTK